MEIVIGVIVLILIVGVVMIFLLKTKNNKKEETYVDTNNDEYKPSQSDVKMMSGLIDGGLGTKPVSKPTSIPIPDFNKKGPIGYVDPQKTNNAYGDQTANNFNNKNY